MTTEEEIRQVDTHVMKLKIQFDLYFLGSVPKPPTDQRDQLDKQLKKLQMNLKTSGERFLYNMVLNKFISFSELWLKQLKIKEEGAHLHPLARRHAQQTAASAAAGGSNGRSASVAEAPVARKRHPAKQPGDDSFRISATRQDPAALKTLYQTFIAAKDRVGDAKKPTFDAFAREIARHAAAIKGKVDCETIDFKIYSSDNKVSLKAKPLK